MLLPPRTDLRYGAGSAQKAGSIGVGVDSE
jgi:hypothetical protein